jgi:rare lipoprotein A (RlpA)-like double-psi beta-barrel protein/surface rod structure-forming protein G
LAVRARRVRRLRIRKAMQRSTLAVVALAVSSSVFQWQIAAGERPTRVDLSPVSEARLPDVGVWVVEGASLFRQEAGPLAEASASAPSAGTSSVVAVRAVVMGKVHDVLTNAATTGELLSAMGITPDASDRVLPSLRTPLHPGDSIRYDRIVTATRRVRVPIPPTTHTDYVTSLAPGQVRWVQQGQAGVLLDVFRVRTVNGRVVSKHVIDRRVLRSAVPAVRQEGRASTSSSTHGEQVGEASWYDAPGSGFTAASPWLPFGTHVTVTNLATGESVVVVIDDRGPFGGRVIDLSPEAFSALASLWAGVMQVRLTW